jgi:hypothetical protein
VWDLHEETFSLWTNLLCPEVELLHSASVLPNYPPCNTSKKLLADSTTKLLLLVGPVQDRFHPVHREAEPSISWNSSDSISSHLSLLLSLSLEL